MTTKKTTIKKTPMHTPKVHKIDAAGQVLGRVATEIVSKLRGKDDPSWEAHIDPKVSVVVANASQIKTTGKKMDQKIYYNYSGYPGGLKSKKMKDLFAKNPSEVLKKAVYNMLPKNKMRDKIIKRLKINN